MSCEGEFAESGHRLSSFPHALCYRALNTPSGLASYAMSEEVVATVVVVVAFRVDLYFVSLTHGRLARRRKNRGIE